MQTRVPEIFTTQRLRAERVTDYHSNNIFEIISSPEVQKTYGLPKNPTSDDTLIQLSIAHNQWDRYGYGLYALFDKDTSAFIGLAGYHAVIIDELNTINCFLVLIKWQIRLSSIFF